jgi:sodium pump decarboxylase gamma subunit
MLNQLLTVSSELADEYPKHIGIGEAAIDALLGFIIVFIGIAVLVGIVWLVGYVIQKLTKKNAEKTKANSTSTAHQADLSSSANSETEEGLSEETVAVITAAIMAYYAKEKPKCEFTVKRIKRL